MNVDDMVDLLDDMFEDAVKMPLTGGKCLIDSQKARDLIDDIRMNLPQEIRQAKAIVADRGEIIAIAKQEAEDIIRRAEEKKKQIVDQSEIVRAAHEQANEILNDVKAKTADMRRAAGEFVEDIMKKTDEAISFQLTELRKTRQNIKMTQKTGAGNNNSGL